MPDVAIRSPTAPLPKGGCQPIRLTGGFAGVCDCAGTLGESGKTYRRIPPSRLKAAHLPLGKGGLGGTITAGC